MIRITIVFIALMLTLSNCTSDILEVNLEEFQLREGHSISLVAQEPLIQSPVAMAQDDQGRLWVAEMRGYMRDIDGNDEDLKDGRIVRLEDSDGDGIMDKSKTVLDQLENPRAVSLVYGGVLYTDSTALIWAPIEGDALGSKILIDSMYVIGGNIEHQPNGLYYNLDNWIYSAKSNARYKRTSYGQWLKEATSFRGQWGISSDHLGRLVYNHNSAPLIGDHTIPNATLGNPYLKVEETVGNYYTDDMRLYPAQATSVNRGYEPDVLDSNNILINYTSACSPLIYYGNGLADDVNGTAFVCAPEANLISNYKIDHLTQTASKDSTAQEFLVSLDETFRPVSLTNGYDNRLYIVDMRKGIIQHTAYMSSYLREKIVTKKLDQVVEKGRIYKIQKIGKDNATANMGTTKTVDLPSLFRSPNLSTRLWAQREIILRNDPILSAQLLELAQDFSNPTAALHAWWTMDELGFILNIKNLPTQDITPEICIGLLPLLAKHDKLWPASALNNLYQQMMSIQHRTVDINLAPNLGQHSKYQDLFWQLAERHRNDAAVSEALVSGSLSFAKANQRKSSQQGLSLLASLYKDCLSNQQDSKIQTPTLHTTSQDDNRTNGLKKFKQYCASCHGYDGNGIKKMAPSLVESDIVKGPEKEIARIILKGYHSGSKEYQMMMPAYINDPNMTDKDVSDIIDYLLSTYAKRWGGISEEEIAKIRTEEAK